MRQIEETLNAYGIEVARLEVPDLDEQGRPLLNGDGPKTVPLTVLTFTSRDRHHRVQVPLTEEARRSLVEMLTGGIALPGAV